MQSRNRKLSFQGFGFQQLESREMMAGHAMAAAALIAHHHSPSAVIGSAVAGKNRTGNPSSVTSTVLTAQLNDATTGMTAEVIYKSCTVNGTTNTSLVVKVEGAAAGSTLDVSLDNVVVGQITVDAGGEGVLSLSSSPKSTQQRPLPANFPAGVAAGAAISVGTATGTLATPTLTPRGEHDGDGCHSHTDSTKLTAQLTDSASSATATATYKSEVENGATESSLKIFVTGAAASSTLDVTIDGKVVGQVTTDANGAGTLKLSSKTGTVPTITAGSTISVGTTLTGSFSAATSSTAATSVRLRHR